MRLGVSIGVALMIITGVAIAVITEYLLIALALNAPLF